MGGFPGSILLTQGDQYKETSDKRHPLGTRGYTRDGRVFRYARAGSSALEAGHLMQAEAPTADLNMDLNPTTSTAPSTGSTKIGLQSGVTSCTLTADTFIDGYLYINDGATGSMIGQMVQLAGNDSPGVDATGDIDVYLREDSFFTEAPTTACEMSITKNKYDDVIIKPAGARTSIPLGVTPRHVTATYYFWLATWGPAPCLTAAVVVIGKPVGDHTSTFCETTSVAGAIQAGDSATQAGDGAGTLVGMSVGNVIQVGADTDMSLIDLKLEP